MAWTFGDSFDLYAAISDAAASYWDAASGSFQSPGRFGGQCYRVLYPNSLTKSSGVNDPVHHITFAFNPMSALTTDTYPGVMFSFVDGSTTQCTVYAARNGTLYLCSGAYGGTVLDSFSGAFTVSGQWTVFEIEVVINNTTGSWTIRKAGNTGTADHTLGNLNTRGGTSNNYANKLQIGCNPTGNDAGHAIDDVLWRSGSTVSWIGDVRTFVRMPASDVQVQFSKVVANKTITNTITFSGQWTAGYTMYTPFTAPATGYVATVGQVSGGNAITGNIKCALFADNAGLPGTVIATSSTILAGIPASQQTGTFTFGPGANVTNGQQYWIGVCGDTTGASNSMGQLGTTGRQYVGTYAAFPVSNASPTTATGLMAGNIVVTPTTSNSAVSEIPQDGLTSYVYDSTVGDADFYGVASISVTPASTIAVTTRQFAQKSDAGSRSGAVQLKSGATTVQSTPGPLSTTFQWNWRTDLTDPATSAAWTVAGVNNAQIGPILTA